MRALLLIAALAACTSASAAPPEQPPEPTCELAAKTLAAVGAEQQAITLRATVALKAKDWTSFEVLSVQFRALNQLADRVSEWSRLHACEA